jgi:hypothetical protein
LKSWSKPGAEEAVTSSGAGSVAQCEAGQFVVDDCNLYGGSFYVIPTTFVVEGMATGQAGIEILNAPGWLANDSDRKEARCLN